MQMNLTPFERLMLSMQLRDRATAEGIEDYNHQAEIIESGYTALYGEVFGTTAEPELEAEIQQEVFDILSMFRAMHPGHTAGSGWNPSGDFYYQKFRGFDGNDGTGHYGFARFLIERQGKFEESAGDYNSHSPTLNTYLQMLERWEAIGRPYNMSEDQLSTVLGIS
jgi:uncharacterized protein YfbU (UPF0304 family)